MNEAQASLRQNLRDLPRGAWILFFGTFLNKFGTFVMPFLAIYMTSMGYSPAQAGSAIAAYGTGSLLACFLGGVLADRLGRRKTIVLSMFLAGIAMLCLSQARGLTAIFICTFFAGLTGELYRPASSALLADLVPTGMRVTAYAAYRMAFNAGWAFGPATAGLLAKKSFTWLFVGDALTSFAFGVVAWYALPAGLRGTRTESSIVETYRILRDDKRFRQIICASLVIGLVFVQAFSTMSLEITRTGFSASIYGLIISLNGVLVVLCELPITVITRRFPVRRVIALGYLLIGLGFASNAMVRTLPLLILTMAIFTLGEMVSMPISGAYIADLAPSDKRGLYMGTYSLNWSLAQICGPSLGMIFFTANHTLFWLTCGVFGVIAAAIISAERGRQPASLSAPGLKPKPVE